MKKNCLPPFPPLSPPNNPPRHIPQHMLLHLPTPRLRHLAHPRLRVSEPEYVCWRFMAAEDFAHPGAEDAVCGACDFRRDCD